MVIVSVEGSEVGLRREHFDLSKGKKTGKQKRMKMIRRRTNERKERKERNKQQEQAPKRTERY